VASNEINAEDQARLRRLLRETRWGALATARDGEPFASWVAFALEADGGGALLHLSRLARHARYLLVNPHASLSLSEPDVDAGADPQQLARVSLQGAVEAIVRDTDTYVRARERYLARLPAAAGNFEFADFDLYRLHFTDARYVPGFGRAHRLDSAALARLAADESREGFSPSPSGRGMG
jgi:hypothetical protein